MSGSAPRIQALAIVSPRNGPIYTRQFQPSNTNADLRYHYFAHSALDIMDERSAPASSSRSNASEQYLGLLYTLEDLAIYGFQTCTKLRFLLMLSLTDHAVRDIDVLTLFRAVYTSYLKYSANPFHTLPLTHHAKESIEEESGEARAKEELERTHEANVPINSRQIKSAAFDARIDRIVFGSTKSSAAAGANIKTASVPAGGR